MTCIHCWRYPDGKCEMCAITQSSRKIQKHAKSSRKRAKGTKTPKRAKNAKNRRYSAKLSVFDSQTEENRYNVLKVYQQAGYISKPDTSAIWKRNRCSR